MDNVYTASHRAGEHTAVIVQKVTLPESGHQVAKCAAPGKPGLAHPIPSEDWKLSAKETGVCAAGCESLGTAA